MADPDDPDSLPTQQWSIPDAAAPGPTPRLSDSAVEGMLGANSPATRGGWQPPTPEELQARLPQYEITALLGRGGMGAVYKGWQKSLDRFVAIKILPPDLTGGDVDYAARFKREAKAMAKLKHPGIIPVHDAGETADGLLYFVMEYVEGTDVQKMLAAHGKLPPEEALPIASRVLDALAYAHQRGIIHRDIKPANIMVDPEGNVLVADFGLARSIAPDSTMLTVSNMAMGTPDFMAPESHLGMDHVDHRADLYAVGVMLYQMLTGKLPRGRFDPPSRAVPGLDKRLDAIVDRTLQNARDARYSSALELRSALEPVLARRIAATASAQHSWRKPALLGTLAVALAAVAFMVFRPPKPAPMPGLPEAEARELVGRGWTDKPSAAPYPKTDAVGNPVFPPGVWTRMWTAAEESLNADKKDGEWLLPNNVTRGRSGSFTNAGMRARFRNQLVTDRFHPQINLRAPIVSSMNLHLNPEGTMLQIRDGRVRGGLPVLAELRLAERVPAGKEYQMEFYAIGPKVIGRVNGQTVTATITGATSPGPLSIYMANADYLRDVEVLNLDGLPEAEALKLAGVSSTPAPQVSSSAAATFADHRYLVVKEQLPWAEAKAKAEAMGGHLAALTSKEEADFVHALCIKTLPSRPFQAWLGGVRAAGKDAPWTWITGEPFGYSTWVDTVDEPGTASCLVVSRVVGAVDDIRAWNNFPQAADAARLAHIGGYVVEWDASAR